MKRIFVSSTFRDMNFERDTLMRLVIPELEEVARKYGDSISFCDLRWGVDTTDLESEEGSRKVLSVCLDEIDSCRPYMIVLLGQRYGWIPSRELVEETARSRDMELQELQKSVTALEIEYGALQDASQLDRTLFYFREMDGPAPGDYQSEDPEHKRKLDALKMKIMEATCGRVKFYRARWNEQTDALEGMEDFARMVTADIRQMLLQEWQEFSRLTPYQQDQRSQWDYAQQKARQFSAREALAQSCLRTLSPKKPILALRGPSGSGKSTLISRMALILQKQGFDVLPIFCGSSPLCTGAVDILRYMVDYLETRLNWPHFADSADAARLRGETVDLHQWQNRLRALVTTNDRQSRKPVYFLIDAVDQLTADEDRANLVFLPANPGKYTRVIFSCLSDFRLSKQLDTLDVPPLSADDRQAILAGIQSPTSRRAAQSVLDAMAAKQGGDNPLYLSLLLTRLEMMDREDYEQINRQGGSMEDINAHQLKLIEDCPQDLNALCVQILEEASRKVGGGPAALAADFLAVSRYGLREKDLQNIFALMNLKWDSLSFSRFRKYMNRFFILRSDGRLDFAHQAFRRGFLSRISNPGYYHNIILNYFQELDIHDPVRMREFVWHCVQSDNRQMYVNYITRFHLDEQIIRLAALDSAAIAMQDEGAWMISLLQGAEDWNAGPQFADFLRNGLDDAFPRTHACLEVRLEIVDAAYEWLNRRVKASLTVENNRILGFCASLYARICLELKSKEDLELALVMLEINQDAMQANWDISGSLLDLIYLADSYDQLGRLYLGLEESVGVSMLPFSAMEYREKAAQAFRTSREMWEQVVQENPCDETRDSFAGSLEQLGSVYLRMQKIKGETREDEEDLCNQALAIRKQMAEDLNTLDEYHKLAACYFLLGKICRKKDDTQGASEALGQCLGIRQVLVERLEGDNLRKELSDVCKEIGDFLSSGFTDEEQQESLDYYKRSVLIDAELADKLETTGAYDDLMGSLQRLVLHRRTPLPLRLHSLYRHWRIRVFLRVRTGNQRYRGFLARHYEEMEKTTPGYSWLIILIAIGLTWLLLKGEAWFNEKFHVMELIEKAAQWTVDVIFLLVRWLFGLFGLL